jgi:hypothetical protein
MGDGRFPAHRAIYRATRNGADAIERSQRMAIRPLSVVMSRNSHASSSTRYGRASTLMVTRTRSLFAV